MVIACEHGARDCPGYPGQFAQSVGHVGGQHDVSENAPWVKIYNNGTNASESTTNIVNNQTMSHQLE